MLSFQMMMTDFVKYFVLLLNDFGARNTIQQMDLDLRKYKEHRDKLEYVDYFNHFLKRKTQPLKYLFVDEAQDLSVHQGKLLI